jgi:hypothetical protein
MGGPWVLQWGNKFPHTPLLGDYPLLFSVGFVYMSPKKIRGKRKRKIEDDGNITDEEVFELNDVGDFVSAKRKIPRRQLKDITEVVLSGKKKINKKLNMVRYELREGENDDNASNNNNRFPPQPPPPDASMGMGGGGFSNERCLYCY